MNLLKAFDRPIAFHPIFVKLTGSVNAALMLSQAVYWHSRTKDAEGWFYKTQAEWEEETCLSRREQEKAREKLRATSFWEEDLRGVPAKLHFRIDSEMFNKAVLDITNNSDEACQTSMHQTAILDCTKPPYKTAPNRHTIYKEAETTTETTTEREKAPSPPPVIEDFDEHMEEMENVISFLKQSYHLTGYIKPYQERDLAQLSFQIIQSKIALSDLKQFFTTARKIPPMNFLVSDYFLAQENASRAAKASPATQNTAIVARLKEQMPDDIKQASEATQVRWIANHYSEIKQQMAATTA